MSSSFIRGAGAACAAVIVLGACTARQQVSAPPASATSDAPRSVVCASAPADSPLVGTWYSSSTPRGLAGTMQTVTVLGADGRMHYESQVKIGKRTRPGLRESGCWSYADGVYMMQTTTSNGEPVDGDDPIYINRLRVESVDRARLVLRDVKPGGHRITAKRMPQGYRLP